MPCLNSNAWNSTHPDSTPNVSSFYKSLDIFGKNDGLWVSFFQVKLYPMPRLNWNAWNVTHSDSKPNFSSFYKYLYFCGKNDGLWVSFFQVKLYPIAEYLDHKNKRNPYKDLLRSHLSKHFIESFERTILRVSRNVLFCCSFNSLRIIRL